MGLLDDINPLKDDGPVEPMTDAVQDTVPPEIAERERSETRPGEASEPATERADGRDDTETQHQQQQQL